MTPASAVGEAPFRWRSIALAAYGPSALASIGLAAILPVLVLRAREVGAGVQGAAVVIALNGIGPLLASIPAGALVGRIGERRALVGAGMVDALSMAVAATAGTVWLLSAAVLTSGVAWTVFLLARQGYMIEVVPQHLRARAMSGLGATYRVGLLVGPLVGAALIARWGIHASFWLAVGTSFGAAMLALTMPDVGAQARADAGKAVSVRSVLGAHRRTLVTLGSVVVVISALRAVRTTLVPLWCDHVHLTAQATSLIFALAGLVDLALAYPGGWLMDRRGRAWTSVPCVLVMGLGFALLPATRSVLAVAAVAVLIAAGNGLGSGIVMTIGADVAPTVGRAQFLGGWRTCGEFGNTTGPLLVAAVAAWSLVAASLTLSGLAWLGAAWTALWVGRLDRARRAPSTHPPSSP